MVLIRTAKLDNFILRHKTDDKTDCHPNEFHQRDCLSCFMLSAQFCGHNQADYESDRCLISHLSLSLIDFHTRHSATVMEKKVWV